MARSLMRGTLLHSQILILNGRRSSLRSLSSDSGLVDSKTINSSNLFADSLKSRSSDSGLVKDNTLDLNFSSLKLLSDRGLVDSKTSILSDPFVGLDLIPDDIFRAVETVQTRAAPIGIGDYICTAAEIAEAFVRYVILCEKEAGIVYKAFEVVSNHSISETCSVDTKLKILSTVFDSIRNYSQIKSSED